MSVYLDNAATSYPKPASVYEAVLHALRDVGATPGRAAHRSAREAAGIVSQARAKVAELLEIPEPDRILFTKNATESINLVLKGWLRSGDHVLISSMEHNAVVRPLMRLSGAGIVTEIVRCGSSGQIDPDLLRSRFRSNTRLVALSHASNVNGALQPVDRVSRLCMEHGIPLLLDAAQTAGMQPIRTKDWNLGMLACSGHKALLGPPGLGILYLRPDLDVFPLIEGGTGSRSEETLQPEYCPDRYESGTPNLPGIAGLAAGLDFISQKGLDRIRRHELHLASVLEQRLAELPGVRVFSPEIRGTGTVSFTIRGLNPADAGYLLDEGFDIAVRTGLHCAPLAHQTLGSFPEGAIRVSPGYSTTIEEIEFFLQSLETLLVHRH
jgi:cysteine desulfurase family protein